MKLVIGGSYQGKCAFAREKLGVPGEGIADGDLFPCRFDGEEARKISDAADGGTVCAVNHYHALIRRQLAEGVDPAEALQELLAGLPDIVLICDEVGNGVIPMEKEERDYREAVGRTTRLAAKRANEVWRVFCGLGERIK